jgi:hypothetical protein
MKTSRLHHHQLFTLLAASLVLITAVNHLPGAVNTFTNRQAWEAAVVDAGAFSHTIFGFNFFPPQPRPAAISNQFAGAGFEFLSQDGQFPITIDYVTNGVLSTPLLPNTGQTIRWRFTRPVNAVSWERASGDDTYVYRIFDLNNVEIGVIDFRTPTQLGGPVFGGFISDDLIGFASSFSDNNDQLHSVDNLRYAFARPQLRTAFLSPARLLISWNTNFVGYGYTLESAASLPALSWVAVTNKVTTTNGQLQVIVDADAARQFFRLGRP